MLLGRRRNLEARVEELRALVVQYREIAEKLSRENKELKADLEDARRRLKSLLQIFFPELYREKSPASLGEMIAVLADGLDSWRRARLEASYAPEASTTPPPEETGVRVDPRRIRARLQRLDEAEREVLELALRGYCTVKAVSEALGVRRERAEGLLAALRRRGFLDVLRVKTPRDAKGFKIYFPSPHGEVACEVMVGKPWSLLHAEELKERGVYVDNERLIKEVELRLKHAGYERVVTELEDPSECTFRYSGGSHRADLSVYAVDKEGREVKVYLECESMSNPLYQVEKMLDAHFEAFGKIYVVVSSGLAKRMMLQRVCYWAWRKRNRPEGFVFEARVEAVDRLTKLGYMPRYLVVRPPAR